jgi:hypothetical protein
MPNFVGLYWTLPVPWAGFTHCPGSRSRRQGEPHHRLPARAHPPLGEGGGAPSSTRRCSSSLLPDRGSEHILPAVDRLLKPAKREGQARLLEFWTAYGWRRHGLLAQRLATTRTSASCLTPPAHLSREPLRPVQHFRTWREVEGAYAVSKDERKVALTQAIAAGREPLAQRARASAEQRRPDHAHRQALDCREPAKVPESL